jgi:hypothetical protein
MFALEIVGKGDTRLAYLGKLVAAFGDDLVFVLRRYGRISAHGEVFIKIKMG